MAAIAAHRNLLAFKQQQQQQQQQIIDQPTSSSYASRTPSAAIGSVPSTSPFVASPFIATMSTPMSTPAVTDQMAGSKASISTLTPRVALLETIQKSNAGMQGSGKFTAFANSPPAKPAPPRTGEGFYGETEAPISYATEETPAILSLSGSLADLTTPGTQTPMHPNDMESPESVGEVMNAEQTLAQLRSHFHKEPEPAYDEVMRYLPEETPRIELPGGLSAASSFSCLSVISKIGTTSTSRGSGGGMGTPLRKKLVAISSGDEDAIIAAGVHPRVAMALRRAAAEDVAEGGNSSEEEDDEDEEEDVLIKQLINTALDDEPNRDVASGTNSITPKASTSELLKPQQKRRTTLTPGTNLDTADEDDKMLDNCIALAMAAAEKSPSEKTAGKQQVSPSKPNRPALAPKPFLKPKSPTKPSSTAPKVSPNNKAAPIANKTVFTSTATVKLALGTVSPGGGSRATSSSGGGSSTRYPSVMQSQPSTKKPTSKKASPQAGWNSSTRPVAVQKPTSSSAGTATCAALHAKQTSSSKTSPKHQGTGIAAGGDQWSPTKKVAPPSPAKSPSTAGSAATTTSGGKQSRKVIMTTV